MGKPMGNGFPLAVVVRRELLDRFVERNRYFNTFGGSLAGAAGLAAVKVMEREGRVSGGVGAYSPRPRRSHAPSPRNRRRSRQSTLRRSRAGREPHDRCSGTSPARAAIEAMYARRVDRRHRSAAQSACFVHPWLSRVITPTGLSPRSTARSRTRFAPNESHRAKLHRNDIERQRGRNLFHGKRAARQPIPFERDAGQDIAYHVHPQTNLATHNAWAPRHGAVRPTWDESGKRYLDAMSGMWSASLAGTTAGRRRDAADESAALSQIFPPFDAAGGRAPSASSHCPVPMSKVVFSCSGSEAVDTAMKLAWYYWAAQGQPERRKLLARNRAYHGSSTEARA
jgi:hypothetical protein